MGIRQKRLAAGVATAALALGLGAGSASAGSAEMPTGVAFYSGVTMLGCQAVEQALLPMCGDFEVDSTEDPAILTVNPFTTDIVILGAGLNPDGGIQPVLEERLPGVRIVDRSVVLRSLKHLGHVLDDNSDATGRTVPMP